MQYQEIPQIILPFSTVSPFIHQWNYDLGSQTTDNIYYKYLKGLGQITFKQNNCRYEGNIINGLFQGKGTFYWHNGIIYEGDFSHNKISGVGKFSWPDGTFYEGQVKNGEMDGQGIFYCAPQQYTYSGTWKHSKKQGKGKLSYPDKSLFEGNFQNNQRHGYGKMVYPSKNIYEGYWQNNKKNGQGTMIWYHPYEKYVGQWKDDECYGYGEYYWLENRNQSKILKNIYKGSWRKGKREGFGAFYFSNGCRFQGYFKQNLKEGLGISVDQLGFAKLEIYVRNRPVSLSIRNIATLKSESQSQPHQQYGKLPKIKQNKIGLKTQIQSHSHPNTQSISHNLPIPTVEENNYKKFIDFSHPQINQIFCNMLLRQNSKLRYLYKNIGTSNTQCQQFYSGMVLQNYWKILRQNKLLSENISLVAIDREFEKGSRSTFNINLPDERIINSLKKDKCAFEQIIYDNLIWNNYYANLQQNIQLNWQQFKIINSKQQYPQLDLKSQPTSIDIHNPSNLILFRHFVCLLIHTVILSDLSSKSLKDKVEKFIINLYNNIESVIKNDKLIDNSTTHNNNTNKILQVPSWVKTVHKQLISLICPQYRNSNEKLDISITVRQMYSILQLSNLFPNTNDKLSHLHLTQKYMNLKQTPITKQNKIHHIEIDKNINIKSNTAFNYIMNYEMTILQFDELMFLWISRKIMNSGEHNNLQKIYKQIVKQIVREVRGKIKQSTQSMPQIKYKKIVSEKDKAKKQLISDYEVRKHRQFEADQKRKQMEREERENKLMENQDYNILVSEISSDKSQQCYS